MVFIECDIQLINLQIVKGYFQFRYNLGSGEAVLIIGSMKVNDANFHSVLLSRTEQTVELIVGEMFVNRTISPGLAATLDVLSDHFYVGARINIRNGTLSNGLRGCVTGLRLDRKEVPVGGDNSHFTTLKISNGVQNGCPIGTLFETPQSDTNVYTGLSVIIVVLCITSLIFVIICVVIQWQRNRRRTRTWSNPPSRGGSGRRPRGGYGGHGEFTWQQPATYKRNLDTPLGDYRSSPEPTDTLRMNSISPTTGLSGPGRHPLPAPVTDVSTTTAVAETGFSEGNNATGLHNRSDSISSSRRRHRLSPVQEGFSNISQSNPGYLEDSPPQNRRESHDGPTPNPATQGQQSRHLRSPSAGHISLMSVGTELSDVTLATSVEGDVDKYIHKRLELANTEIEELNVDSMIPYKDEGPYEPLGSIGSLYDFVRDLDSDLNQTTSTEMSTSSVSQSPVHSSLLSLSPRPKSPSSGQPTLPHYMPSDDDELKNKFSRQSSSQRSGKRASKHGSHHKTDHSMRMNSIMDKFHSITVGNRPTDSIETRLI